MRILAFTISTLLSIGTASLSYAQIVNGSFENWTNGEPDGWATSNVAQVGTPITQSSTAYDGSSSAQGTVLPLFGSVNLNALMQSGPGGTGFPISQRYTSFSGYYQFTSTGGDAFGVNVVLAPVRNDTGTAVGAAKLGPTTGWTQFTIPLTYYISGIPDSAYIQFLVVGPTTGADVHIGSVFRVDDISFSGSATDVRQQGPFPSSYLLEQNFPNPFNPSTHIAYVLASAGRIRLTVYDILGRQIARLADGEQAAGLHRVNFNAAGLPSGVYIYRLQTGGFTQEKRMLLLK